MQVSKPLIFKEVEVVKKAIERVELPNQLSVWDISFTENPKKVTKTEEKLTEIKDSFTKNKSKKIEIPNQNKSLENEKSIKPLELTALQQDFINKNEFMKSENLSRIIQYCGGGLGIELQLEDNFRTIYVNREGKEEFEFNKKSPVLPMDKILYYKEDLKPNEIQEEKLKKLQEEFNIEKVIRRKGDKNIIAEVSGKVISINSLGWVLEFDNVQAIYSEDEVIKNHEEEIVDIESLRKNVKIGDFVEAYHGKEIIQGEIVREYGLNNGILNIVFANGRKHTAIGRYAVRKIIKCA